jgi:hypothetical protein
MATRQQVQKAREATRDVVKSFEATFKEVDQLFDSGASDEKINEVIRDSGIPETAFIDAYNRYYESGGVVDYGAGRAVLQGLTLGFSDELEAMLPSAISGLEGDYEQRVGQVRAGKTAYEAAKPGEAMAAEVAGAIPTALIPGGLAVRGALKGGTSLAGTMARGAGVGAAEGAIGGAGRAETMGEVPGRALLEGGIGGVVGGVVPLATTGISSALRAGRGTEQQALSQMSRALPEQQLVQAEQRVAQRVASGDTSPLTLAEMGGATAQRELRGLRGGSAEVEGIVEPRLTARMAQQGQRVEEAVEKAVGMGPESSVVLGNVIRDQENAAAPLYREIRAKYGSVQVKDMQDIFERESFREAYPEIVRSVNERLRGQIPDEILNRTPRTYDEFIRQVRSAEGIEVPFDFLDQAKRAIGSKGLSAKRGGDENLASLRFKTADDLRARTDAKVPEYQEARRVFAGEAAIEEAMDVGRKFERMTPAEVRQTLAKMEGSEKEAFITGAVDALRLKIGEAGTGVDLVRRLKLEVPFQRQRLAAMMGGEDSPAFKAFERAVREEAEMAQTRNVVLGGSQTAAFQRDVAGADMGFDDMIDILMNPASVTNVGALTRGFRGLLNKTRGAGGQTGQRVAEMLTETSPAMQQRILEGIRRSQDQARRGAALTSGAGVAGAAGAAQAITGLLRD